MAEWIEAEISGMFYRRRNASLDLRGAFDKILDVSRDSWSNEHSWSITQVAIAENVKELTLRGMHFQRSPFAESKFVTCLRGEIFDAVVDLRPNSPSFRKFSIQILSAENRVQLFVPKGCAHGYLTLMPETDVMYIISGEYSSEHSAGFIWSDASINIPWPASPNVISDRDSKLPSINEILGNV